MEKLINLSSKHGEKKIPRGYKKATMSMIKNLKQGDYVCADLGGIEFACGKVDEPIHKHWLNGNDTISFWSYSGWKHIEYASPEEIVAIKKAKY